jgi:hypothetical protein
MNEYNRDAEMRFLRMVAGSTIWDHKINDNIREKFKVEDVNTIIKGTIK